VETLGARSLNRIIEQETAYVRKLLANNKDGIKGLLRMLQE